MIIPNNKINKLTDKNECLEKETEKLKKIIQVLENYLKIWEIDF